MKCYQTIGSNSPLASGTHEKNHCFYFAQLAHTQELEKEKDNKIN